MARGNGSTFEAHPAALEERKSGRLLLGPGRRQNANQISVDDLADADPRRARSWHHDIFHADGKPYREDEVKLIRELTGR